VRWRGNWEGGHDRVATGREESNEDAPSQKRNSTKTTGTGARVDKEKEEVNQRD
jgi:hypothetical protein